MNFSIFLQKTVDKFKKICYNAFTMKIIPNQIVIEADNLSKEIGISFRDCLEVLYRTYLIGTVRTKQDERPAKEERRRDGRSRKEGCCPSATWYV